MKKLINADRDLTKGYRYITNHGMGPGTVPDDVHILHWEDLPNYKTAFWTDRFLTTEELNYYDVKEAPITSSRVDSKKSYVRAYDYYVFDDLVNYYEHCDYPSYEVWDRVYNDFQDESLADDVVDAIYGSTIPSNLSPIKANWDKRFVKKQGGTTFSIRMKNPDSPWFEAMVSEVHPYNDAEYVWAKIGQNKQVKFVQSNNVIDKMQLHYFDEDEYASLQDYQQDVIDSVIAELVDMNKSVEPIMVHN